MDHIKLAIDELEAKLAAQLAAASKTKLAINILCETIDEPPRYDDLSDGVIGSSNPNGKGPAPKVLSFKPDHFFGKSFSASVREVLQMRKSLDLGPATIEGIYDALKSGGYAFEAKDAENQLRGLNVSISKNSALFAKLPSGLVGLAEWYDRKKTKSRNRNGISSAGQEQSESSENEESGSDGSEGNELPEGTQ